jgi:hypothetical protein
MPVAEGETLTLLPLCFAKDLEDDWIIPTTCKHNSIGRALSRLLNALPCEPAMLRDEACLETLGIPEIAFKAANFKLKQLFKRIESDDDFVRSFKLEALRESLTLAYPSYILALAMGAGKTVLIGAIIATEFAMALEYPDGPFVQNALAPCQVLSYMCSRFVCPSVARSRPLAGRHERTQP